MTQRSCILIILAAVALTLGVDICAYAQSTMPLSQDLYTAQGTTNAAGVFSWVYPAPCTASSYFFGMAQGPNPSAGVLVNVQLLGPPVGGVQSFQVNVSNVTLVSLLGLSVLSIPASPGATPITVGCRP